MFESVLLPAPFSPSSACTSPAAASKSTRSFATTPGKRFVIPRMRTAEAGGAPSAPLLSSTLASGVGSPTNYPLGLPITPFTSQVMPYRSFTVSFFPAGTISFPFWS